MSGRPWTARALAVLAAVLACGWAAAARPAAGEPIRIGFFAPLTGENAEYGRSFRQAITLYVDGLNAAGGIEGRPVAIVAFDDRSDPREAANIAQRLAADPQIVATIGSFSSTASMAAAPILERAGVVQLSPTSSHPDFTGLGSYMFRNTTIQALEAPAIARYAVERVGARTIAIAYRQDDWGLTASEHFRRGAQALGARIVLEEGFIQGERDFRPFITRLRSQRPDALHLAMFYADAAVFAQQLQQAGLDIPVVTSSSLYHPEFVAQGGSAVEGYYVPSNFFPGNPAPVVREFVEAYQRRWGAVPDAFAAQAYDSVAVMVEALRSILAAERPLTRRAVRDALHALPPYEGVTGTIRFDERGDVEKTLTWLVVRDGRMVLADRQ